VPAYAAARLPDTSPGATGRWHDLRVPEYESGLTMLAPDTYAYLRRPGWGWSNSGLIAGGADAVLVDTAYTPALAAEMLAEMAAARPGADISRCVLTHGNGDHSFGAVALPASVELVTSRTCADTLEDEVSPAAMTAIMAGGPEPLRSYMVEHFGCFDYSEAALPKADTTFEGRLELAVGGRTIELIEVGPAHTTGDVAVHVPDAGVLYTGDIVFVGDAPIAWASARGIVEACRTLAQTGAHILVPGHGPVVGAAYLDELRGYFERLLEHAAALGAAGVPYHEAAARFPLAARPDSGLAERVVISTAAAYRDLGLPVEDDVVGVLTRMAALAAGA
jgi:glyoxylase-like metal-dependent hydrolase (beta-lactamase superfamily II)